MIKINIIPNKIKKEIKINFVYNLIKSFLYMSIIVLSILGIILMISEYILLSSLAKEINSSSLNFKNTANTSQNKVNDINTKLLLLENVQNDFIRWSTFFNFISKKTPEGIKLSRLTIKNKGTEISFSGNAKTRNILLSFKEMLEKSAIFENIQFPIQNLLQKENINFEIKAKLKKDEIK